MNLSRTAEIIQSDQQRENRLSMNRASEHGTIDKKYLRFISSEPEKANRNKG